MTRLEQTIEKFEKAMTDLEESTRAAHAALKDLREERRTVEQMLSGDVRKKINDRVEEVVKEELDKIGPTIRSQTSLIYERVGNQVDKLVNLALGKEFSKKRNNSDLRPLLAEKLREFIVEVIDDADENQTPG